MRTRLTQSGRSRVETSTIASLASSLYAIYAGYSNPATGQKACLDMHIDKYEFGRIVIDGAEYDSDLIIVGGAVQPNWRRKRGHTLSVEDLQTVIAANPAVLIVGCGAYGALNIPEPARQSLQQLNIKLETLNTQDAVERFNELCEKGIAIAAAFHLTC